MFVIRGSFSGTAPTGFTLGQTYNIPAEHVAWQEQYDSNGLGYLILNAVYIPTGDAIVGPLLGVIGKSGRFAQLSYV